MASSSENTGAPLEEEPQLQAPPTPNPEATEAAPGEAEEEEEEPQTLERAQELFDKGSKAIEDEDFVEAVDCLSQALEIRTSHYGELAPECASTYFKYGCALLYKAQEESDFLGNVPKGVPNEESVKSTASKDDSGTSKISSTNVEDAVSSEKADAEEGQNSNGKDQENGNGEAEKDDDDDDDDVDEKMGDEEDNDLDLSWKMLDIARAIVEKSPENTIEKVKIYSALAEVATEREDIDNSLSDYKKALSMLEHLVEPDHRRVVELNFRICLVYELVSKIGDAIPYCAKAISLCKSRIQSLKSSKDALLAGKDGDASAAEAEGGSEKSATEAEGGSEKSAADAEGGLEKSAAEKELEQLTSILPDLEKKLEDLEQANPSPAMDEMVKTIASRVTESMPRAASFTSSQMATSSNGFDSSVLSTAATTGSSGSTVTDLGVVGRGVKRASIKPISAEPAAKKPALDSTSLQVDSSINSEAVPSSINSEADPGTQNGDESVSK